jgi:hypothetical protein
MSEESKAYQKILDAADRYWMSDLNLIRIQQLEEDCQAKDAEISRLEEIIESEKRAFRTLFEDRKIDMQTIRIQRQLIFEMANALEFPFHSSKLPTLIRRAREVTGGE